MQNSSIFITLLILGLLPFSLCPVSISVAEPSSTYDIFKIGVGWTNAMKNSQVPCQRLATFLTQLGFPSEAVNITSYGELNGSVLRQDFDILILLCDSAKKMKQDTIDVIDDAVYNHSLGLIGDNAVSGFREDEKKYDEIPKIQAFGCTINLSERASAGAIDIMTSCHPTMEGMWNGKDTFYWSCNVSSWRNGSTLVAKGKYSGNPLLVVRKYGGGKSCYATDIVFNMIMGNLKPNPPNWWLDNSLSHTLLLRNAIKYVSPIPLIQILPFKAELVPLIWRCDDLPYAHADFKDFINMLEDYNFRLGGGTIIVEWLVVANQSLKSDYVKWNRNHHAFYPHGWNHSANPVSDNLSVDHYHTLVQYASRNLESILGVTPRIWIAPWQSLNKTYGIVLKKEGYIGVISNYAKGWIVAINEKDIDFAPDAPKIYGFDHTIRDLFYMSGRENWDNATYLNAYKEYFNRVRLLGIVANPMLHKAYTSILPALTEFNAWMVGKAYSMSLEEMFERYMAFSNTTYTVGWDSSAQRWRVDLDFTDVDASYKQYITNWGIKILASSHTIQSVTIDEENHIYHNGLDKVTLTDLSNKASATIIINSGSSSGVYVRQSNSKVFSADFNGKRLTLTLTSLNGFASTTIIYTADQGCPRNVYIDGGECDFLNTKLDFDRSEENCWFYNGSSHLLYVKIHHQSSSPLILKVSWQVTSFPFLEQYSILVGVGAFLVALFALIKYFFTSRKFKIY